MKNRIPLSSEFITDILQLAFDGKANDPAMKILVDIQDEDGKLIKTVSIKVVYDPLDATYAIEWIP